MNMTKFKTAELTGPALDWAVAKAERVTLSEASWRYQLEVHGCIVTPQKRELRYSTDWSQGGPLIAAHLPDIQKDGSGFIAAVAIRDSEGMTNFFINRGETYLLAACRAIVAAKLGDVVSVPTELLGGDK